jgi:hypothetical protein
LGATRYRLGFGLSFLDADNDGRLDLVQTNGHVNDLRHYYPYEMPAQILQGAAGGRFRDVSARAGEPWASPLVGRGLAAGDLDNDGRVDLVLLNQNAPLVYLHNRTEASGHFLTLGLEGRSPGTNRDAIGSLVTVRRGGSTWVQARYGGGSYQSSGDPRLHFGLGLGKDEAEAASRTVEVEVRWPSGRVDRYHNLGADRGYLLQEGEASPRPLAGFSR